MAAAGVAWRVAYTVAPRPRPPAYHGQVWRGRWFENAQFVGATFLRCDFRGANLVNANLRRARLWGCDFRGSNLYGVILTGAVYDRFTVWPEGFDAAACGARLERGDERK